MQLVFGILVGLFVLMFLVTAHELGHFFAAKKNGVKVDEFGIGFPPRAIAFIKKGYKWQKLPKTNWSKSQDTLVISFNWIPIGGFCAIHGESDSDTRPGTFGASSFWTKTKILFGGVAANWLIAFLVFTTLAWTGMPVFLRQQFFIPNDAKFTYGDIRVATVLEDSPASRAGFQPNDQIIAINGQNVHFTDQITAFGKTHAGETVTYTILRNQENLALTAQLNPADSPYALGIHMTSSQTSFRTTWSAPLVGLATTAQLTGETFKGVGRLVWNLSSGLISQFNFSDTTRAAGRAEIKAAGDSVTGPIGIIGVIFPAFTASGLTNLAFLTALISISLACMNVLPIPALDGGRWLLIALFRLKNQKLTQEIEAKIVARAWYFLFFLVILITILDITRLFSWLVKLQKPQTVTPSTL